MVVTLKKAKFLHTLEKYLSINVLESSRLYAISLLSSFPFTSSWDSVMLKLNLPILPLSTQWDFTQGAHGFCLHFLLPERSWYKKGIFESNHKATTVS